MLYELTLIGRYFEQQTVCRWNYVSTGVPAAVTGSFALAYAFGAAQDQDPPIDTTIMGYIMSSTSSNATWQECIVRALYDVNDFYTTPFVPQLEGQQVGDDFAVFASFGFRTNRVRQDIGRGYKRLPGVLEAQVADGGYLIAGALTGMNELAGLMSDVLTYDDEGNTLSFSPCVVQKQEYVVPDSDPERVARRYYATLAAQMEHVALGIQWQPYTTVRSQMSRQYGHGA